MQVNPKSAKSPTFEPSNMKPSWHLPHQTFTSSLQAAKRDWGCIGTCTSAIFRGIYQFLRWVFCCTCCCGPTKSSNISTNLEINTDGVDEQDPFFRQVFKPVETEEFKADPSTNQVEAAKPSKPRLPENEEVSRLIEEIFDLLGNQVPWTTCSPYSFTAFNLTVQGKEQELAKLKPHPLLSLFYMMGSRKRVQNLVNFESKATQMHWSNQGACSALGHPDPWKETFDKQAKLLAKRADEVLELLEGFCRFLELDEDIVREYANHNAWRPMIEYVYQERKNQFEIR